ncbi:MAG: DsbA family protein [Dehalococcoidia bacterium]
MLAGCLALSVALLVATACSDGDSPSPTAAATAAGTKGATSPPQGSSGDPTDPAVFARLKLPLDLAKGASIGNPDAKVTLEAYEDFQCPFCLLFTMLLEPTVMDEYVAPGKVRFVFRNFPILGAESVRAALASVCAADEEKFWPFHQRLFLEQAKAGQLDGEKLNVGRFSPENLRTYATDAGAAGAAFDACVQDAVTLAKVQDEVDSARQLGLRGTPSLVLNGKPVATPPDAAAMRKLLDDALAAAK